MLTRLPCSAVVCTNNYKYITVQTMENYLNLKYKLKSSENFEEYLKLINVGLISRKTAISVSPSCFLTKDEDDNYTITVCVAFRTIRVTFKLGEEFIEDRADGSKVKSTFTIEGNKLIQTQVEDNGRKSMHVREFTKDRLTVTTTADDWDGKCVRVYERVYYE